MHSFMWQCIKTNFVRHALNRPQIGGKKGEIPLVIDTFQYNGTFWRRQKLSENKKKINKKKNIHSIWLVLSDGSYAFEYRLNGCGKKIDRI